MEDLFPGEFELLEPAATDMELDLEQAPAGMDVDAEPTPVSHFSQGLPPVIRLYSFGGRQRLEHLISGEVVVLEPPDAKWVLEHSNGFGFLKAHGRDSVWVDSLLQTTVWNHNGSVYLETESADGADATCVWLSDVVAKFVSHYSSWPATVNGDVSRVGRLEYIRLSVPRDGVKTLFNLKDVQFAAEFETPFCASSRWFMNMQRAWETLLSAVGVPPSHLMRPTSGTGVGSLRVHAWHGSATALILILLKCIVDGKSDNDKIRCRRLLFGFLCNFLPPASDFLVAEYEPATPQTPPCYGVRLVVHNFVITCDNVDTPALRRIDNFRLDKALEVAFSNRVRCGWLLSSLVVRVSDLVDLHLEDHAWPSDPLKCLTDAGKCKRLDRQIRQVVGELPMAVVRNQHRAFKLMKALGLAGIHHTWVDAAYMRRYLVALRQGMPSLSYAITADKSRGSGKDWLSGCIIGCESKLCGWMQPVVTTY